MSTPPKPKARVRRILDVSPLRSRPERLLVRPFFECFDRGSSLPVLTLRGELNGQGFEITIGERAPLVLAASASGSDGYGPFAALEEQEHLVGEFHALRVEADAHDVDTSPAVISYIELPADVAARRELAYAERWYSVYFNPRGLVDGAGSGGPRSYRPRPLPS